MMSVTDTQVREIVEKIMGGLSVSATISSRVENEAIFVNIDVQEPDRLLGREGRGLEALQYLVQRIAGRTAGEEELPPIVVDVNGYRKRREEELSLMAKEIAARVHASGASVLLGPMAAWERKIVHIAVRDEAGLETESEDSKAGRRVRIRARRKTDPEQAPGGPPDNAK